MLNVSLSEAALCYTTPRVYGEFRLAWPRPCGIDMLKSFVLTPGQGRLQILRPMVAVRSLLEHCADLKACSSNVFLFL